MVRTGNTAAKARIAQLKHEEKVAKLTDAHLVKLGTQQHADLAW